MASGRSNRATDPLDERDNQAGIIPRDFRSEYSLAGHSFLLGDFRLGAESAREQFLADDRGPEARR